MGPPHRDLGWLPEAETGISFPKLDECQDAQTQKPAPPVPRTELRSVRGSTDSKPPEYSIDPADSTSFKTPS